MDGISGASLERFEGYWGEPAAAEGIDVKFVPDGTARTAAAAHRRGRHRRGHSGWPGLHRGPGTAHRSPDATDQYAVPEHQEGPLRRSRGARGRP
ncbi:hypothetical protein AAHB37_17515 [Glutamicibacter halophytocola]|uniref:hypothetical protein n=1 Tax=Glutamicibacter halophytocola TaxID=1933880 RepID=UPI0032196474